MRCFEFIKGDIDLVVCYEEALSNVSGIRYYPAYAAEGGPSHSLYHDTSRELFLRLSIIEPTLGRGPATLWANEKIQQLENGQIQLPTAGGSAGPLIPPPGVP